jgi:hypothetical protein
VELPFVDFQLPDVWGTRTQATSDALARSNPAARCTSTSIVTEDYFHRWHFDPASKKKTTDT